MNGRLLLRCYHRQFAGIVLGRHTGQVDGGSSWRARVQTLAARIVVQTRNIIFPSYVSLLNDCSCHVSCLVYITRRFIPQALSLSLECAIEVSTEFIP